MRIFQLLGTFTYRWRWAILAVWAALVVASIFFAPDLSGRLKGGGFEGSNSEAERVQNVMSDEFGVSPATLVVVFEGEGLSARGEEFRNAEDAALEEVRRMPEVRYVTTFASSGDPRFVSEDGGSSYAVIAFNVSVDQTRNVVDEVRAKVRSETNSTPTYRRSGRLPGHQEASNEDIQRAEKYAFPFALLILVLAFGTWSLPGVPVLIGGVSVAHRARRPVLLRGRPTTCPSSC